MGKYTSIKRNPTCRPQRPHTKGRRPGVFTRDRPPCPRACVGRRGRARDTWRRARRADHDVALVVSRRAAQCTICRMVGSHGPAAEGGTGMTTFHSWDDVKREIFDAEDLDAIAAGAQRMVAEARAHRLAEMRKQLGLTQSEVAARMHVRQERVSAIERGNTKAAEVGTIAAYVAALGGRLEIVANFDGTPGGCRLRAGESSTPCSGEVDQPRPSAKPEGGTPANPGVPPSSSPQAARATSRPPRPSGAPAPCSSSPARPAGTPP